LYLILATLEGQIGQPQALLGKPAVPPTRVMSTDFVLLATYQALYLYATLLPLHWAGCLRAEETGRNSLRP